MKNNIQEKISSVKNTIKKIQNEINSFQLEKKNNNNKNIYNYSNNINNNSKKNNNIIYNNNDDNITKIKKKLLEKQKSFSLSNLKYNLYPFHQKKD